MKRSGTIIVAVVLMAAAVTAIVGAQTAETPFPSPKIQDVFVSNETVTSDGTLANYFKRGSQVTFRATAGDTKTGQLLTNEDVKYFYVAVPGQPNVKLAYKPGVQWQWEAPWTIPATFPTGLVNFKVLLKTKSKQYGSYVQIPVATAQLTVQP